MIRTAVSVAACIMVLLVLAADPEPETIYVVGPTEIVTETVYVDVPGPAPEPEIVYVEVPVPVEVPAMLDPMPFRTDEDSGLPWRTAAMLDLLLEDMRPSPQALATGNHATPTADDTARVERLIGPHEAARIRARGPEWLASHGGDWAAYRHHRPRAAALTYYLGGTR